jgi:hypothetical protein
MNLRSYEDTNDLNDIRIEQVFKNDKFLLFNVISDKQELPILKTSDVTVNSITNSNDSVWNMTITIMNEKDLKCIKNIDNFYIKLIEHRSEQLFGEQFDSFEIFDENIVIPSILSSTKKLTVHCIEKNGIELCKNICFGIYEPNKTMINAERLVPDSICRCAIRPWMLQIRPKTRRVRILWIIEQCMILEEPVNTDCILDPDDQEEDDNST